MGAALYAGGLTGIWNGTSWRKEPLPAPGVLEAIEDADFVLFPPSNPVVSIGPVLAVPGIRAAVAAMQKVFHRILAEGGIAGVENEIASVADVFALQGDRRMREIEKDFLR